MSKRKFPDWFKFHYKEWANDECRLKLKRENSDTWLSVIILMHQSERPYVEGTREQLANQLRLTAEQFDDFFEDLRSTKTAKVRVRKIKKAARENKSGTCALGAEPTFFEHFVHVFRITSRRLSVEFRPYISDLRGESELRGADFGADRVREREKSKTQIKTQRKEEDSYSHTQHAGAGERPPHNLEPTQRQSIDDFLTEISANPKYAHIDIDEELLKATEWCRKHRRHNTQTFFRRWIERIDPPLPRSTNGTKAGKIGRSATDAGRRNGNVDRESAADIAKRIGADIR